MKKEHILSILNSKLLEDKSEFKLTQSALDTVILDISRVLDKKITNIVNEIKNNLNIKINSNEKEDIRKSLLGYPVKCKIKIKDYKIEVTNTEIDDAYTAIEEGFFRNEKIMTDSIYARITTNFISKYNCDKNLQYLEYLAEMQNGKKQLMIIELNSSEDSDVNSIISGIESIYDSISNYHYLIIIFKDHCSKSTYSWSKISNIAIRLEHLRLEKNFSVFEKSNKQRRKDEFCDFIKNNDNVILNAEIKSNIENFYSGVSYGFHFEDLFITQDGSEKVLVMQKIELDESQKKCPSCLESKVRGNSYPKILLKSFECQNESCPSRSKIGRGKRFDILSAKRQTYLLRHSENDMIDNETYQKFRRDILPFESIELDDLIKLYSWDGDNVVIYNSTNNTVNNYNRFVTFSSIDFCSFNESKHTFDLLELFKSVKNNLTYTETPPSEYTKIENSMVVMGNSTNLIHSFFKSTNYESTKFEAAITSPPYYNAREYSQWKNFLLYLVDMLANANSVFSNLKDNGTYIYNIGDIVGQDNIYINSNMSKKRIMLGFYSIFIFEIVGFNTIGNIIWDKGEVQSKRNSTSNHFSGYIKPVNAYEHCIIFKKSNTAQQVKTTVSKIDTVRKINSKGINTFGHTAPYPLEIAALIKKFINPYDMVIDPYLGSGTTAIALFNRYKVVGFELNYDYYKLAVSRIQSSTE